LFIILLFPDDDDRPETYQPGAIKGEVNIMVVDGFIKGYNYEEILSHIQTNSDNLLCHGRTLTSA